MNEFADPSGPDESSSPADRAGSVFVGDQAQHGQMPRREVLPERSESEVGQGERGVEAGRGKVVHEGPWVVIESSTPTSLHPGSCCHRHQFQLFPTVLSMKSRVSLY